MMTKFNLGLLGAVSAALLVGCASVGPPPRTGTAYQCSAGTRLAVSYTNNGALVRVNGGSVRVLLQTPSNSGAVYENKAGARLARDGNGAMWNTSARSAPESCRVVATPL